MSPEQGYAEPEIRIYPAPEGAVGNGDFSVKVRTPGGEWRSLFSYNAKVDMHHVRDASMVMFDCTGPAEIEAVYTRGTVEQAVVRPLSAGLTCEHHDQVISLKIDGPRLLSLEVNGERFHNLHIFANPMETEVPDGSRAGVLLLKPDTHDTADILRDLAQTPVNGGGRRTLLFGPGLHRLQDDRLDIPSGTTVYLEGGAVVYGGLICDQVHDVTITGRGILYMSEFEKNTFYRGVEVSLSRDIRIEGITVIDPPHYTVLLGESERIRISNLKSFSTRGWCDGIDMMACSEVNIEGGFLRTSDDCIAVYASRGDYRGDTRNITASGTILWADVAHPVNIGTHGDHEGEGNVIENLRFTDIDILEHHEPQPDYWGCLAINAGDNNIIRNVTFEDIRIEDFELGELFNLRVLRNEKYNPVPGRRIEQVLFKNIHYSGISCNPSHIEGYDEDRWAGRITFEQVTVNGKAFGTEDEHLRIGKHVREIKGIEPPPAQPSGEGNEPDNGAGR